jgi:alpha-glucosidase (family GH31 glycosyl hydrolase)
MTRLVIAGQEAELEITQVSEDTARLTFRAVQSDGIPQVIPYTGALVKEEFSAQVARGADTDDFKRVVVGNMVVALNVLSSPTDGGGTLEGPLVVAIDTAKGEPVQRLTLGPSISFQLPKGPLLGLGEGGPQFDRKGNVDMMRNGQGGYHLATHGTRAPVQWMIGTDAGWGMFIHQPYGAFDLTKDSGVFTPTTLPPTGAQVVNSAVPVTGGTMLPLDIFVTASRDPVAIMGEYARITGLPEMPARWTLGYQQSHRTLAGPDEVMGVAKTMREKKLPCDTLIYLGTEFTPSGWNTRNGEFTWNPANFPDPKKMLDALHDMRFRVVLHIVVEGKTLTGRVTDPCTAPPLPPGRTPDNKWPPDRQVSCYWPAHKPLYDIGVDGWWPDQGDGFDGPSRLNRHRMYWEGPQLWNPEERPFALHRNASAGVQRYGGYIWSGDIQSRWDTLAAHVPVAINTGLSGLPYWGTDIGGFYGTPDFTGELFVRWFQFAAFCPLFRSHGRNWHLHTPWGWDGGDGGPNETQNYTADPAELHNKEVEPICRKYLELRYKLLPYTYTAMEETHRTGLPMMRALWLHYPDDPKAVACGDQYLWGRDIMVAPVTAKGATTRSVYLPKGTWYDFWTNEKIEGGQTIERAVDLAMVPLYVRAGAVIATGPVLQYAEQPNDEPLSLTVCPGADGTSWLYEDDGHSFDYRTGLFSRISMKWNDRERTVVLELDTKSRARTSEPRRFKIGVLGRTPTVVQMRRNPTILVLR